MTISRPKDRSNETHVVYLDGPLVTDSRGHLLHTRIAEIMRTIADVRRETHARIIVVSAGSIAAGRSRYNGDDLSFESTAIERQFFATAGRPILIRTFNDALQHHGLIAHDLQLSPDIATRCQPLIRATLNHVGKGIPIITSLDVLDRTERRLPNIGELAVAVATALPATSLIMLSTTAGIHTDPNNSQSPVLDEIKWNEFNWTSRLGITDKTTVAYNRATARGGHGQKAASNGIPACLISGVTAEPLTAFFAENAIQGTRFIPKPPLHRLTHKTLAEAE